MSDIRRRYSIHEVRRTTPLIEEREPEIYNSFKQRRRTVIFKTTIHRRHSERVERSPSPTRYRRRRSTPSPPPQRRSSSHYRRRSLTPPRLTDPFTMSPTDSPAQGQKYIPLPTPLPTKEEEERARKAKKALKEKPKVSIKSHKHHQSYDTGYGSASPYSYEERSPEQYIPSPKSAKPKPDTTPYETIDGKSGTTRYITKTKDGKVVRYVSRKSTSPIDAGYGAAKPAEPYKTKYKAAKETTKALQDALYDSTETAQHNYVAAKEQEAKRLSASAQIDALEEQLRSLRLKAQIYEDLAETAERQRLVAERKLREQEIKQKIADQKKERTLLEEDFARRQWDEIEAMPASPSPITRRPARTPLIEQASKPRRNNTATPSPYTSQAMTTASQVPGILAPSGNPFLDPILEAQKDEEDRRRATGIQYSSSRRERRRGDDRYK